MKTLITFHNPELSRLIFHGGALERLKSFSEVDWLEDPGALEARIGDYDACISSWGSPKITKQVLMKTERLRFIGHAAGTVVPYVDEDVLGRGITVVNANSVLSRATAEGTVAMMAAGAYCLPEYSRMLENGGWANNDNEFVPGLTHQTIGLIGYGDISREVMRLLEPYHANILLYSEHCDKETAARAGAKLCGLDTLLNESFIVSLHNTLTPQTRGMLGTRELELMRNGALLINTARAAIINEAALIKVLRAGRIRAILDVYEREPLEMDHPLRGLPNVWLFPHIAAYSGYWK